MNQPFLAKFALLACLFTLVVISLGAFTRLVDAGLGCPDWPGCYGHIIVPANANVVNTINAQYPQTPLVAYKAWAEMTHRFFAGSLGILMLAITILGIRHSVRRQFPRQLAIYLFMPLLLAYQITLGMLTVTWKLLPLIVSLHLLGGMLILSTLWLVHLLNRPWQPLSGNIPFSLRVLSALAVVLLFCQISLGAWTSTNYASLSCPGFPTCFANTLLQHWDFKGAFNLFHPIGINYQGGVLAMNVRSTIQMVHRSGALIVSLYLVFLAAWINLRLRKLPQIKKATQWLLMLLFLQLCLGISNVLFKLPLLIAVAHSVCAGLLLMSVIYLNYCFYRQFS
ncbi:MAG: COX15/CtaA family protein [Legionellales bacterium]|nr:COX15/CtaA family protein [Legionellales bacterium]